MDNAPESSNASSTISKRPRWELTALAFAAYAGGKHLHWSEGMLGFFRIFVIITGFQLIEYRLGLTSTQTKFPGRYTQRTILALVGSILLWNGIESHSWKAAALGGALTLLYYGLVRKQLRFIASQPTVETK